MSEYDGSIRINIKIDSKEAYAQLMTLQNRITKTADKIASLRSKMDALKGAKIPTQEYKEISDQIAKAESEFNKLLEKQEQMQREGKDNGAAWDRLNQKMDEAGNTIRYAKGELQDLIDTGKAFTLGSDTEEFAKLRQQLKYAENDMDVLIRKHRDLNTKQGSNSDGYKKLGNTARKSLQSVGSILKNAKSQAISMGNALKNIATRIFPFLNRSAQKTDGFFSTIGSRLKGMAISLLIFNQISKAFNSAISGMKEGIGNLAQYSSAVNSALSSMKSALTQLKNSLASAFAPILTVVAPILTRLINMLASAVTYIGMFIAALTGKKTFEKAVAVQEDYVGGLKDTASAAEDTAEAAKEANKQLSSLDKLNNLTSPDSGSGAGDNGNLDGGGAGGGISPGDMFETVEIPGAISDLAEEIRNAIKKGDWESVGEAIGEALTSVLERINWDAIYEKARNFGTGLASFLNGLISPELFSAVAKTIAGSLNTALHFLDSFGTTFDWKNLGDSISEGINSFFQTFDWKLAVKNFNTFSNGLLTTMIAAVKGIRWKDISQAIADAIAGLDFYNIAWKFGNLVNSLSSALYQIVSNKDTWKNLGDQIADGINGFLQGMSAIDPATGLSGWESFGKNISSIIEGVAESLKIALESVEWDEVGQAVVDFICSIDWGDLAWDLGELANTLGEAFIEALFGSGFSISEEIAGWFGARKEEIEIGYDNFKKDLDIFFDDFSPWAYIKKIFDPEKWVNWDAIGKINFDFSKVFSFEWSFDWFDEAKKAFQTAFDGKRADFLDIGGWILEGIIDGFIGAISFIFEPIARFFMALWEGICSIFGIHSPATEMNPIGENILFGIITGFVQSFGNIGTAIGQFFSNVRNSFSSKISEFSRYWSSAWNGLKNSLINIFGSMWEGIRGVFNSIISGIQTVLSGLNTVSQATSGVSAVRGSIGSGIGNLAKAPIPRLATGTVVPPNREFMAVLGDNKREPEVVSPISTIEQAVENALRKNGGYGNQEIIVKVPVSINEQVIFEIVKRLDREQFNRTGQPSFQI